jgi:hypothetical protein
MLVAQRIKIGVVIEVSLLKHAIFYSLPTISQLILLYVFDLTQNNIMHTNKHDNPIC